MLSIERILQFVAIGLVLMFGCGLKNNLTQAEVILLREINFNAQLISEIKALTNSDIKQLPEIEKETAEVLDTYFGGIYSEAVEVKCIDIVKRLKPKFRKKGYLIFVSESEDFKKNVAVIKGTDELDILRYRVTNGINYGLKNDDLIKKVTEWKSRYGLVVIGCSLDWFQLEFDRLPEDLDKFANEVYEFCPDSVDQGVGSVDALRKAIKETRGVWLWWD